MAQKLLDSVIAINYVTASDPIPSTVMMVWADVEDYNRWETYINSISAFPDKYLPGMLRELTEILKYATSVPFEMVSLPKLDEDDVDAWSRKSGYICENGYDVDDFRTRIKWIRQVKFE